MSISLERQLACAQRELALRKQCYPSWVAQRSLPEDKAQAEIAAMEAIVATLTRLLNAQPCPEQGEMWGEHA